MTWGECMKRLEWMAEACKRPGGVVIGGDDAKALEMAVEVMRTEGEKNVMVIHQYVKE